MRTWILVAAALACTGVADAQTRPGAAGRIAGRVVEARTGTPLAAVLLQIANTRQRTLTDEEGRFTIEDVPAGPQTLVVSVVGFGLVRHDLVVAPGQTTELTIPVVEGASAYVEDVVVAADASRPPAQAGASQSVLGSGELLALGSVMADDPLRAVHAMPGVATGDDYRGDFAVRGLGPAHIGFAIDGIDSPFLFHSVRAIADTGSLALVNSEFLEDATLLPGAHAQVLGSHLGARLDFRTRDGARDRMRGRLTVGGSSASTLLEGPIGDGKRGSWLVAGRKSYLDWLLHDVIDAAFGFTDGHAKLLLIPAPNQTLRVSVVAGRSLLDEDPGGLLNDLDRGYAQTVAASAQWRFTASSTLAVVQQLYFVRAGYVNRVADGRTRDEGRDRDVTWRGGLEWAPAARHFVQFGGQAQSLRGERIAQRFTSPTAGTTTLDARPKATAGAAWLAYRWMPAPTITVSPGARVEHWSLYGQTAASPWLLGEWTVAPSTRLRGGVGVSHQSATLDDSLLVRPDDSLIPERARTVEAGLDWRPLAGWKTSATMFHRDQREGLRLESSEFRFAAGALVRPDAPHLLNALDGRSYGVELTIERRSLNGLTGALSYAWSRSRVTDVTTGEQYDADFDQRHTLNTHAAYRWSERTSIGLQYRFGSNFPLQGYFAPRGDQHVLVGERNAFHLSPYARLDVRADRSFTFRKRRLTIFAEVINATNHANYRTQNPSINPRTGAVLGLKEKLFPVLPSAGLLVEF